MRTRDFFPTLDSCRQYLADWGNSGRLFCIDGVPLHTLDSDCCHRDGFVMGSSLLLLACNCALAGRSGVGIRFRFYTVGGTGNPAGYPPGLRWIFEHLPFFGVQTEKLSMQNVSPRARALMWSAGVTSSAVIPTLSAFLAWRSGVPWSGWFCLFALFWALGTLASNWTSRTGDYSKARRALSRS